MGVIIVLSMLGLVGMSAALPTECVCAEVYDPVCGDDGKTYSNECAMNCVGVNAVHKGQCRPLCACPRIYRPVCGTDGKTYANSCTMTCQGITLDREGSCDGDAADIAVPCICTFQYDPVCGVNGITYGNECNLKCAGVAEASKGQCPSTDGSLTLVPPIA